ETPHQIVEIAEFELLAEFVRAGAAAGTEPAAERLARLARPLGVEAGLERNLAELVVVAAPLGALEDFPGARDLLEPLLGRLVSGVQVRVILARELAIGLPDRFGVRIPRDAEDLVQIPHANDGFGLRISCMNSARVFGSPSNSPRIELVTAEEFCC